MRTRWKLLIGAIPVLGMLVLMCLVAIDRSMRRFDEGKYELKVLSHGITKAKSGRLGVTLICETQGIYKGPEIVPVESKRVYLTSWVSDEGPESIRQDFKEKFNYSGSIAALAKPGALVGKSVDARVRYDNTLFTKFEQWDLGSSSIGLRNKASAEDLAKLK